MVRIHSQLKSELILVKPRKSFRLASWLGVRIGVTRSMRLNRLRADAKSHTVGLTVEVELLIFLGNEQVVQSIVSPII
jgi:hypothetical protein